jgi:hypothetical protein
MEFAIYYTLGAIVLYFLADWILQRIETIRGEPFKHRNIIYFLIIFLLALGLMEVINPPPSQPPASQLKD